MKILILIFQILLVINSALSQTVNARNYAMSDTNFWIGKTYLLPDYYFGIDNYSNGESFDSVITFLIKNPELIVEIGCHTDNRRVPMTLDTLSDWRAKKLKEYFIYKGLDSKRIFSHGYGDHFPRIIEKDTNITFVEDMGFIECRKKSFFFKKGTTLDENYLKNIKDKCLRELIHNLNRRTEMKILKIE
ncbi:MAG: OmpA family protein [Bacteroidales bacterium]